MSNPTHDSLTSSIDKASKMFTGYRNKALYNHDGEVYGGGIMMEANKVAWIDVPEQCLWFFNMHWCGATYASPQVMAKYIVDNGIDLPRVKATFAFLAQYSAHSFTHYDSKGVTRHRVAKKPLEMVKLSWDKRGIASVIQSNEYYLHRRMGDGGLKKCQDIVFSLLPSMRLESLTKADTEALERLQMRKSELSHMVTHIEGVSIDMDKVIKSAIDDALSIKFAGDWLAEILTGTHTYNSVNVLETQAPETIIIEFHKWLAGEQGQTDFVIHENAMLSKTTIGEIKALMAECVLGLGLLKAEQEALYAQYGLTPTDDEEE